MKTTFQFCLYRKKLKLLLRSVCIGISEVEPSSVCRGTNAKKHPSSVFRGSMGPEEKGLAALRAWLEEVATDPFHQVQYCILDVSNYFHPGTVLHRPYKCPKFYVSRILGAQNFRQKESKIGHNFNRNKMTYSIKYTNSTVFNIRLYKTST